MGKWETKFKEFFEKESNKNYAYPIFSSFIFGQLRGSSGGKIREILNNPESYKKNFFQIFEDLILKEEYTSSIFPTLISPKEASNFFLREEKRPNREEVFRYLYLVSTGIYHRNIIINLITEEEDKWENFLSKLKSEEAFIILKVNENQQSKKPSISVETNLNTLKKHLGCNIPFIPLQRNIFLLAIINFFVVGWLKEKAKIEISSLEEIGKVLASKIGISDDAVLVVFEKRGNEKAKVFFYPRLSRFIQKWYSDSLTTGEEKNNYLPRFLFSLVDFDDDRSIEYLDKFLYFLFRGNVNGEILEKLLNQKIKLIIDSRKESTPVLPILEISKFCRAINE
ncbi:MAG: hypothetical protein QW735_04515 [archaeon]